MIHFIDPVFVFGGAVSREEKGREVPRAMRKAL